MFQDFPQVLTHSIQHRMNPAILHALQMTALKQTLLLHMTNNRLNRIAPVLILMGFAFVDTDDRGLMQTVECADLTYMTSVPRNQWAMQKMVINQVMEASITQTQPLAMEFLGIFLSPEGLNFKVHSQNEGCKQAVQKRDCGTYDWSKNMPISD